MFGREPARLAGRRFRGLEEPPAVVVVIAVGDVVVAAHGPKPNEAAGEFPCFAVSVADDLDSREVIGRR